MRWRNKEKQTCGLPQMPYLLERVGVYWNKHQILPKTSHYYQGSCKDQLSDKRDSLPTLGSHFSHHVLRN